MRANERADERMTRYSTRQFHSDSTHGGAVAQVENALDGRNHAKLLEEDPLGVVRPVGMESADEDARSFAGSEVGRADFKDIVLGGG